MAKVILATDCPILLPILSVGYSTIYKRVYRIGSHLIRQSLDTQRLLRISRSKCHDDLDTSIYEMGYFPDRETTINSRNYLINNEPKIRDVNRVYADTKYMSLLISVHGLKHCGHSSVNINLVNYIPCLIPATTKFLLRW